MEYPMISFDATEKDEEAMYFVLTHEIGHNWFPMIVGSNERTCAWMDEGFDMFINQFSLARRYPAHGDQTQRADRQRVLIEGKVKEHHDLLIDLPPDSTPENGYTNYRKPAGVLQMLRRDVVGPVAFDKGLRTYIRRWAYKHPTPMDFFRTMEDVSGRKLDWFWREWFFETPGFDQAINAVRQTTDGRTTHVTVVYGNLGRGVLPLLVRFTFDDGTTRDITYPAEVWRTNSTSYTVSYSFHRPVVGVTIDPDEHLVDADRSNNRWTSK